MTMKNLILTLTLMLAITSCSHTPAAGDTSAKDAAGASSLREKNSLETTIYLQPFGNFTEQEAKRLTKSLDEGLHKIFPKVTYKYVVLAPKPLPEDSYYKPRNRYLADVLLKHIGTDNGFIFGLTHKDISFKIHGHENYGIMGLTRVGGNRSIVSDFRVGKNNFVPVIVHEYLHGVSSAQHCENQDCLMCDYSARKNKKMEIKLCSEKHGTIR